MTNNQSPGTPRLESRWPPAIALSLLVVLLNVLPGHVVFLPVWVSYVGVSAVLAAMAAVAMTRNAHVLRIERMLIMLLGAVYVVNTCAELADMVGVIAIHPKGGNAYALLSSAVGIWVENVVIFSVLFWQVDGGGPYARARGIQRNPDWGFPTPPTAEGAPSEWTPQYIDYLFLAYNTATAFSPTDALPYTHRAKSLMTLESAISLVTLVIVLSRAINVLPTGRDYPLAGGADTHSARWHPRRARGARCHGLRGAGPAAGQRAWK